MTAARRASDDTDTPSLGAALVGTAVTLGLAAWLQLAVYGQGGHALSDIPGRFLHWGIGPGALPYVNRPVEYPVVIGFVAFAASWLGRTAGTFFLTNGGINAGLAVAMTALLWTRGRDRIWRWALGAPVALYVFHNWDLVAMVPAVIGLYAFERHRDRAAGVALAIGASAKVFPGLVLAPLVAVRWCSGDRRGALRLLGSAVLTTIVLNLPVAWASWSGWSYPLRFQGGRAATWGSLWFWALRVPLPTVSGFDPRDASNVLAGVALVTAIAMISIAAVRRALGAEAIGAAVIGAFLLANKVYSPNYDLWLVPFFVLLPITRRVWVGYCASVLAIFVLVYGTFHGLWSRGTVETFLFPLVVIRAVTIIAVIRAALRSRWRGATPTAGRRAAPAGQRGVNPSGCSSTRGTCTERTGPSPARRTGSPATRPASLST